MNKACLIDKLGEKEDLKEKEAYGIVNMIFDGFTNTL